MSCETVTTHSASGASDSRSLGADGIPIYINRLASRKYLNYSMNTLKPATESLDCAGIRRMGFGQPLPLCEERVAGARVRCAIYYNLIAGGVCSVGKTIAVDEII